jgi:predicted ATPase with chaperone activity
VAERVAAALQRQAERFAGHLRCLSNAEMGIEEIRAYCVLDGAGYSLMKAAVRQLELSPAAYRTLRPARTIADLAVTEQIGPAPVGDGVDVEAWSLAGGAMPAQRRDKPCAQAPKRRTGQGSGTL